MNVTDRKEPESVIISSNECNRTVLRVVVTDATTEIALALAYRIFCDNVFGPNQPIFLVLFECRDKAKFLESVAIELTDYAPDLLQGISYTDEASVAFKDVDIVFSIGRARGYEFTEEEYTELFFKEFVLVAKFYGQAIERYAKRNVKVIVLGNTAATIISRYATSIPPQNITALSKFNLKMSAAHIAARVKCHPTEIKNIIIWGTNNKHTFPDCRYISFKNGKTLNTELNVWLRSDLPSVGILY
ncbi:hypothetical protein KM043_011041 [Ampulex compressa]|nr:hypothetical protein KM043_011041 [Ampulex compressa]